jgi:hypothetical protein
LATTGLSKAKTPFNNRERGARPYPVEMRNPPPRYAASRPTDCSCGWTRSPAPRPPPPSSIRVPDDGSGASVPAVPYHAPSSAAPRPGIGVAGRCLAAPPSSATGGRNLPFSALLYVAWNKGEKHIVHAYISSVSDVSEVCCNSCTCMLQDSVLNVSSFFRRMLQVCLFG